MTPMVIVKLLTGNTIQFPLKRAMCGCPRKEDVLVFQSDAGMIHAKVNRVRWFLDENVIRIHALELKPEERDL
jgi:hypothetical protein